MWATLLFAGTAAIFVAMTIAALWHLRWVRRLPALEALATSEPGAAPPAGCRPRCSVVVAARDEEARIEQTVRHLLAQRGIEAEIIVVDDRSSDRTGEIVRRLAGDDPRLRAIRIDALPDGWLGKCHACHVGASAATGQWILFTDADCWLQPDVIARAVRLAERDGVVHVTLTPGTVVENVAARAWHLLFLTSALNWISGVNRDRPRSHLGIGAFNLVRTETYRDFDGYHALRLSVVDDIKLGQLVRRVGGRTRAFLGVDDVECHWGTTVRGMVKIMEKNYFAVTDFRLWLVVGGSTVAMMVLGLLVAGLVSGTASGLVAALSPCSLCLPAGVLARRIGWSWPSSLLVPFMIPVFLYSLLNSTFVTLRQGGIRWRDTFYPLETLRTGTVR